MSQDILFTEFRLGDFNLKNRFVMAPMTRNRASSSNVPTPLMAEYYRQRSSAGLIITEGSQVTPQGQGYPNTPGIYSQEQVHAWKFVSDTVHKAGGKIFLQLWHVGRISHSLYQPDRLLPVAPSAVAPKGKIYTSEGLKPYEIPRALEEYEIPKIVQEFKLGAQNAKEAGFDGVEIHGANGYLIDQFLRDGTNKRTDRYGGPVENRIRFLIDVTKAVLEVWGESKVGVRLSPSSSFNDMSDSNPEETFLAAVKALNEFRVAYVHIIEGTPADLRHGGKPVSSEIFRSAFKNALIVNAGYTASRARQVLSSAKADLVSFGVPFLANPDLPLRFQLGAALNTPDPSTFYGGNEKGYTDYPTLDAVSV